jgi:hypothetical protein
MNKFIVASIIAASVGCSTAPDSEPVTEPVAEESQAATHGPYSVTNGGTTVPTLSTRFCHATYMRGNGGHSGSANWPNGYPKQGAVFGFYPPSANAFAYNTSLGTATIEGLCEDFSNYGFGPSASKTSDSSHPAIMWTIGSGSGYVSTSTPMWNYPASLCFLNGALSLSASDEGIAASLPAGGSGDWLLYAQGVPEFGAYGTCVFPHKSWTLSGPYTATPGNIAVGPTATSTNVCVFASILGNLDDGWARIRVDSIFGTRNLDVGGSVVSAQMWCAQF